LNSCYFSVFVVQKTRRLGDRVKNTSTAQLADDLA
jgi:hypothetical protein